MGTNTVKGDKKVSRERKIKTVSKEVQASLKVAIAGVLEVLAPISRRLRKKS